jgi:hypothetical protein
VKRAFLLLALATVLLVSAPGAGAAGSRRCGVLRASVPYSRRGHGDEWRVYITGATSCRAAQQTLDAVMHLRGKEHRGTGEADSFFAYRGWTCPFGNMGSQLCSFPARAPVRARALALDCTVLAGGCPRRAPTGYFG